jgi:antibiotic biosynthesis monooxygenase (ABM) superfamily enzyme
MLQPILKLNDKSFLATRKKKRSREKWLKKKEDLRERENRKKRKTGIGLFLHVDGMTVNTQKTYV